MQRHGVAFSYALFFYKLSASLLPETFFVWLPGAVVSTGKGSGDVVLPPQSPA
jgi:hypothetical protein